MKLLTWLWWGLKTSLKEQTYARGLVMSRYYKNIPTSNIKKHSRKLNETSVHLHCESPRVVKYEPTKNLTSRKRWHLDPLAVRKLPLSTSGTHPLTFSCNTPTDRYYGTRPNNSKSFSGIFCFNRGISQLHSWISLIYYLLR